MRIAFDYQIFCHQSYGGISRYFVRLAEELITLKQDIEIFAPIHHNNYLQELSSDVVNGYKLPGYLPKTNHIMLYLNYFLSTNLINKWKPQLVHETNYSKLISTPKYCPSIITIFDMIHELFPKNPHDNTSQLKKEAVKRSSHIICISENTKQDLINYFGTEKNKISVVHLGCSIFKNNKYNIFVPTKPYILYVGRRSGYKNFKLFIKAISSSNRIKKEFNIIAFGGGKFTDIENNLFLELGLRSDQVIQISGDDALLGLVYSQAAALVHPSLYEGFGLSPLEAMVYDCPVISSNTSSMPEVIGCAGEYFDPNIAEDIVAATERVVFSPERSQELIMRGKKRLELFTWNDCAKKTLNVYKSIV